MINLLIKAYQRYNDFRCYLCKQISDYLYIKCYSNLYKNDDECIRFFNKKDKAEIKSLIIKHLQKDECLIMDKLEDYIF